MDFAPAMNVAGRRVTVMGLGRFGGGVGAVRFLTSHGARVTVTDLLGADELVGPLAQIADCPVEAYHLGGHLESDFVDTDLVVVNPAVPPTSPFLEQARQSGVPSHQRDVALLAIPSGAHLGRHRKQWQVDHDGDGSWHARGGRVAQPVGREHRPQSAAGSRCDRSRRMGRARIEQFSAGRLGPPAG